MNHAQLKALNILDSVAGSNPARRISFFTLVFEYHLILAASQEMSFGKQGESCTIESLEHFRFFSDRTINNPR